MSEKELNLFTEDKKTTTETKEKVKATNGEVVPNVQQNTEIVNTADTTNTTVVISDEFNTHPIQQYIENTRNIISWVMSFTYPTDWVIYRNNTVYLKATGAERIATLMNIKWTKPEYSIEDFKDEKGKIIERIVTCKADFILENSGYYREIKGIEGYSSTKDISVNKYKLPPLEVSIKDLKKVALSKMILEGVRRLLGIREINIDMLPEKWRDKIEKVEFEDIKELKEQIHQWLVARSNGKRENYINLLRKISDIPAIGHEPVDKVSMLSNKAVKYIIKNIINKK